MGNYTHINKEPYVMQSYNAGTTEPKGGCYYDGVYYAYVSNRLVAISDFYSYGSVDMSLPDGVNPSMTSVRIGCIDDYLIFAYCEYFGVADYRIKLVYYNLTTQVWSDIVDTGKKHYGTGYTATSTTVVGLIKSTIKDGKFIIGYCNASLKYCTISYYPGGDLEFAETSVEGNDAKRCFDIAYYGDTLYLFVIRNRVGWLSGGYVDYASLINADTGDSFDLEEPNDGLASNIYTNFGVGSYHVPYVCVYEDGIRFMYQLSYSPGAWNDGGRRSKLIYGYFDGTTYTCKQLLDWGHGSPTLAGDPPCLYFTVEPLGGVMPQFTSKRYMIGFYNAYMDEDDYADYVNYTYVDNYWRYKPFMFRYDFAEDWLYFARLNGYGGDSLKCSGAGIVTLDESEELTLFVYRSAANYSTSDSLKRRYRVFTNLFHLDCARVFYKGSLRRTIPYIKINGEMKKVNAMLYKYGGRWQFFR